MCAESDKATGPVDDLNELLVTACLLNVESGSLTYRLLGVAVCYRPSMSAIVREPK